MMILYTHVIGFSEGIYPTYNVCSVNILGAKNLFLQWKVVKQKDSYILQMGAIKLDTE